MEFEVIRSDVEPLHCPRCQGTRILQRDYYALDYPVVGVRRGADEPVVVVADHALNLFQFSSVTFESPRPVAAQEHMYLFCQACELEWRIPYEWDLDVVASNGTSGHRPPLKRVK